MNEDSFCANCNTPNVKHGLMFAAGFWGYACDPINGGRDQSTLPRVHDITEKVKEQHEEDIRRGYIDNHPYRMRTPTDNAN